MISAFPAFFIYENVCVVVRLTCGIKFRGSKVCLSGFHFPCTCPLFMKES